MTDQLNGKVAAVTGAAATQRGGYAPGAANSPR